MQSTIVERSVHGHHKLAASVFVGSMIVGAAMILSAELTKPERYEYHPGNSPSTYVIYDRDTGEAIATEYNTKHPIELLGKK